MDIRLALMAGTDIPMPEIQLTIHQPRIREIALMGEPDFFAAAQYLGLQKEQLIEDKSLLSKMNNFQILMEVIWQQKTSEKKTALITLLSLMFPSYQPMITPKSILLRSMETQDVKMIDTNNFEIFQNYIREILCLTSVFQGENIIYNPGNAAAQAIANKIMAGRRKVAEIKGKDQQNDSIIARYISILTIGIHSMSLNDLLDLTLYQLFDLIERYTLWLDWDIDLRQRLAGGTPKTEAENWMKSLYSKSSDTTAFSSNNKSDLIEVYTK